MYVGGAEHAVLHLLYSRFWHKVSIHTYLVLDFGMELIMNKLHLVMRRDSNKVNSPL